MPSKTEALFFRSSTAPTTQQMVLVEVVVLLPLGRAGRSQKRTLAASLKPIDDFLFIPRADERMVAISTAVCAAKPSYAQGPK